MTIPPDTLRSLVSLVELAFKLAPSVRGLIDSCGEMSPEERADLVRRADEAHARAMAYKPRNLDAPDPKPTAPG